VFSIKGLRAKTVLCALIPIALVLVVVAIVALYAYERVARDIVQQRDTELARVSAARLSEALSRYSRVLQSIAAEDDVQSMEPARLSSALEKAQNQLYVFDAGVVVYSSEGVALWSQPFADERRGTDFPVPSEFDKVRRTLRPAFSNVFQDTVSGEDVVLVGVPIVGSGGEFKGVLAGMFRMKYPLLGAIYAEVLQIKVGHSGYAYLVDGNGQVIYHPNGSQMGRNLAATVPVMRATRGETGAVLTEGLTGESVISGFAPVPGTGWGLITQERWGDVVGPIRGYSKLLLGLLVVGGVLSSALIFFSIGRILGPIQDLTRGAQRIAGGDFDHIIVAQTGDEIQALAQQFNTMASALKESYTDLERRVAECTAELRAANEEIQRRADELAALYEVGHDLAATLDLEVLLPAIAQRVTHTLGADRCTVFLFDEGVGMLRARAAHGYMAERLADFGYRPGEEIVGQAYATGEPQYVPDLDRVPHLPRRDAIRAVLAVPLVSPTAGPLGVLSVTSLRPEAFTPYQQQLLETMAGQIAGAIENARLYEETERHATELAALYEIGKEITSILELNTMLQTIADDAVRLVGADKSLILLIDAEKERLTKAVGHGYSRAQLEEHTFEEFQDGLSGWVLREKVPTLSADIQTDERNRGKALVSARRSGDRSAAVAPLIIGDKVIGTLTVVNSRSRRVFTSADLNLVTMLAGQAAIAIQNARLYEAAQEADRLKSVFLATMSHELRTPLNTIIGFTGIMLQGLAGPLKPEQEKQLNMVYDSAKHLLALINDILDLSKIEAGEVEIIKEEFDVASLINKVVKTVSPLAEQKGLGLTIALSPEVGRIFSDRRRVEQILLNLVNNAIKFTERGWVRIEGTIVDKHLQVSVQDTGIGIKPEDMPKLFQAFCQIDTGLARKHEGTGLGLSICKKLVTMLGGEIWAESEYGVGSKFSFTLPIEKRESH
jgi:signal transduction histidine kinase